MKTIIHNIELYGLLIIVFIILGTSSLYAQKDAQKDDYKIGAEDILLISVWENSALTLEVIVRPDGKISYPLLDDISVENLTVLEVKEIITKKLSEFVTNPQVTVILRSVNNYKIFVLGAVDSPGVINLRRQTTLLQLLAMVGGQSLFTRTDLSRSYILRNGEKLPMDFEKLIDEGDISQNIILLPDDIIFFPDNFYKRITIIGEVMTPQTIPYRKGLTILDAVLSVGGPTVDADLNNTKIIRKKDEEEVKLNIRLKDIIKKGNLEENFEIQPGDSIIIPSGFF